MKEIVLHWDADRNTFMFPWGEMIMTLENVYRLMGLRPQGVVVRDVYTHGTVRQNHYLARQS